LTGSNRRHSLNIFPPRFFGVFAVKYFLFLSSFRLANQQKSPPG
jgi:hypothetical protein